MNSTMQAWNQGQAMKQSWYKLGGYPPTPNELGPTPNGPPPEYREPPLTNGYDNKSNHSVVDHYYYPDSDLETIVEESSVLDSEDERGFYAQEDPKYHQTHRRSSDQQRTPHTSDSSYSSLSSSSTPRHDRSYEDNGHHRQPASHKMRNTEDFAPVDPYAQQKIVYAKCLTPRNDQAAQLSEAKPDSSIDVDDEAMDHSTISDMFEAARLGDLHALNTFSASELNDTVDERGNTALHIAAENGHMHCIRRLVSTSNNHLITLPNDDLMTPTAMAIKSGHLNCVQWLVRHTAAREELSISKRPSSFDGSSTRPPVAHVAARYDRNDILDWLCEEMKAEGYPIDTADHCSNTPVHVAARYGHLTCIQTLVSRGASVTMLNSDGDTPGQAAQKYDHDTCVGYLVVVETCVSLAQQVVALRNDMEALRIENEQLKKDISSPSFGAKSKSLPSPTRGGDRVDGKAVSPSNGLPPPPPAQMNGFHDLPLPSPPPPPLLEDALPRKVETPENPTPASPLKPKAADERKSTPQRRVLEEQPPPPKLNVTSPPTGRRRNDIKPQNASPQQQSQGRKQSPVKANAPKSGAYPTGAPPALPETSLSMQEKINAALNGPGTSLDDASGDDVTREGDVQREGVDSGKAEEGKRKVNSEVENLTKDLPESPQKKPWEKLSMDEMLKLVREIRYQPSPSISLCTEDSTMESVEVMRERLAAASRWFLVERTRGRAPTYSQGLTSSHTHHHAPNATKSRSNAAGKGHRAVASSHQSANVNLPRDKSAPPAVSWVTPPSGNDRTAASGAGEQGTRGKAAFTPHTYHSGGSQRLEATDPASRQSGTLKFMVTNGKSSTEASPTKQRGGFSPDRRSAKSLSPNSVSSPSLTPQGTPPTTPNNFSAQRNSSYRRAVDKQQEQHEKHSQQQQQRQLQLQQEQIQQKYYQQERLQRQQQQKHDEKVQQHMYDQQPQQQLQKQSQRLQQLQRTTDTRSSSDSLSSGSTNSRSTAKSHVSDKRSTVSSKSSRSAAAQSTPPKSAPPADPLQKRTGNAKESKNLASVNSNPERRGREEVKQEQFKAIERPVPVRKYQPPTRPVATNNQNRAPFSWSLPRCYTAPQTQQYKEYNSNPQDDEEMVPASEVPEFKAEIPSRQSSFLRKVQGKFK